MSQPVDIERIRKFKEDRKRLPYDDITIAGRMKVDRSNYSKAVNNGPITNTFLQKFYGAFGDELKKIQDPDEPVESGEIEKRMEEMERRLELRMKQFEENMALLVDESLARIEALLGRVVKKHEKSQGRRDG